MVERMRAPLLPPTAQGSAARAQVLFLWRLWDSFAVEHCVFLRNGLL